MVSVSLVATLGLSLAVVFESILALESAGRRSGVRVGEVYLVYTSDPRVEACAGFICDVLGRVGIGCMGYRIQAQDISSSRDNVDAYWQLRGALASAAVRGSHVVVSVAGGRKTLPALAAFIVYAAAQFDPQMSHAAGKTFMLVHVLVPPKVELSQACRGVCGQVEKLRGAEGKEYSGLVNSVAERFRGVRRGYKPLCTDGLEPSTIEECMVPCVPTQLAALPGPGIQASHVYSAVPKVKGGCQRPATYGGCQAEVNLTSPPNLVVNLWDLIDMIHSTPVERGRCTPSFKGFSQVGHHARVCGHLDKTLWQVVHGIDWVLGFVAQGVCKPSTRACEPEVYWDQACCCYAIKVDLPCRRSGCYYVEGVLYTTAVTRGQAEIVAERLRQELAKKFSC